MPGATPVLTQTGEGIALYALSTSGEAATPGLWAGYRPSPGASFGASASLEQAWEDAGGVYLFLGTAPPDAAAFLAVLDAVLARLSPTGAVRALWLANPADPPGAWRTRSLQARASGAGPSTAWTVSRRSVFALGGYAVEVAAGTALAPASEAEGYGVSAAGAVLRAPGGLYLSSSTATLPFSGAALGAWGFSILLLNDGGSEETTPDDLARLGAGLRYAVPSATGVRGTVDALPMPLLSQAGQPLSLAVTFDPLHPTLPARTRLAFAPPEPGGTIPPLACALVTPRGYATTLTPTAPAALAFCASPRLATEGAAGSLPDFYLAPDGPFALAVDPAAPASPGSVTERISLGISGLEYVGLPASGACTVLFRAGGEAYAPGVVSDPLLPGGEGDAGAPLSPLGTTSYAAFLPAQAGEGGLPYFAQPPQAPLFTGGGVLPDGFLEFHEMRAATLPAAEGEAAPVPVGVYAALDPAWATVARLLEQSALAPARRAAIEGAPGGSLALAKVPGEAEAVSAEERRAAARARMLVSPTLVRSGGTRAARGGLGGSSPPVEEDAGDDPPLAVTPQGLVASLSEDGTQWAGVVLANLPSSATPRVALTAVGPAFQSALQSSELFVVVADVDEFMSASSVAYRLDEGGLAILAAGGMDETTVSRLRAAVSPGYPVYPTEDAFVAAVSGVTGSDPDASPLAEVLAVAGLLKTEIEGWTFQLSPRTWRRAADSPTLLVFKFCNRSLEEVIGDPSAWGWSAAAGDVAAAQRAARKVFADAEAAGPDSPYAAFLRDVVADPAWNGILFLNAPVQVTELPDGLQFLAAGIDPAGFYARHVGFSLTPFGTQGGGVVLGRTAAFALVDYQDPVDLYVEQTVPFAFKTLALTARFANAALADFSARVELLVNRLFGAPLTKVETAHGNNLVLAGSYQTQGGSPSYAFVLQGRNEYATDRSALDSVEVLGVQLQTATGMDGGGTIAATFVLSGNLRFREEPFFDAFSFGDGPAPAEDEPTFSGWLRFGNLVVTMTFPLSNPAAQTFSAAEDRVSLDPASSVARPRSLAANFPVRLTGLTVAPAVEGGSGQTPEELGFTSVAAPMDQTPLSAPWYGLVFSLDLGTLGSLSGGKQLSVTLLAGWGPGLAAGDHPVYLGLMLPGAKAIGVDLPLQGVMRLGFRSFQFEAADEEDGSRSYLLLLRRLALSILGWSFPPGNTDVLLFGSPDGSGRPVLGWYAAYAKDPPKKTTPSSGSSAPRALAAGPAGEGGSSEKRATTPTSPPANPSAARRLRAGRRTPPPVGGV